MLIRTFRDDDDLQFVEVRNRAYPDAASTVDETRQLDRAVAATQHAPECLIAEDGDGRILGYDRIQGRGDGRYLVSSAVDPAVWRRGAGRAIWRQLASMLEEHGATIAETGWIDELQEAGLAFLAHLTH